jgi:hypothetical protein
MNGIPRNVASIVSDNEAAVARSLNEQNFVQAYLLVHALARIIHVADVF